MKSLSVLILLAAIGVGAMVYAADGDAGGASPFAGKVVLIYAESSQDSAVALTNARIEKISGKDFLVGIGADSGTEGDWVKGVHFSIAFDRVVWINQFTPDEFDQFRKNYGFRPQ